ncbi:MAG: type II toxin-antitoxin system HicB family antitoxin [Promethearchaeota archaeon]
MLVKIEVYKDEGYRCARGIGEDIFTQGETMDELMDNMREAVTVHFEL